MVQIGGRNKEAGKWFPLLSFRRLFQLILLSISLLSYSMISKMRLFHEVGDDILALERRPNGSLTEHLAFRQQTGARLRQAQEEAPTRTDAQVAVAESLDNDASLAADIANNQDKKRIIGYVVVITGCAQMREGEMPFPIAEGAAVLKHSIARATASGPYGYKLYAIYHPQAAECAKTLAPLGYTLLERDTPVQVSQIKGDFLRERIVRNGCCGEKELIKFEAYTLTQHEAVILLDLDVLILQPLDDVLDLFFDGKMPDQVHKNVLMWPDKPIPQEIHVIHTIDYAMANPGRKVRPFQGGFAILRPNRTVYEEFVEIIREGDFRDNGGWGGKSGKFWGGQTFQGLMPYYHHILHPNHSVELNWCTYNNMASPSTTGGLVDDKPAGKCYTGELVCEDCRNKKVQDVVTAHFTVCQKPWLCMPHASDLLDHRLCRELQREWFKARSEMELSWGRSGWGESTYRRDHFFGYCAHAGRKGYALIAQPYGSAAAAATSKNNVSPLKIE